VPDDLIGQAIVTGAFVIAAAQIWCVRAWLHHRTPARLTTTDPQPNPTPKEHTRD